MYDDIIPLKKKTKKQYTCNCTLCGYTRTCDELEFAREYIISHILIDHQLSIFDENIASIKEEEVEIEEK